MTQPEARATAARRQQLTAWRLDLADPTDAPVEIRERLTYGLDVAVPGSVLGALVAAGLVGDVTIDATEQEVAWPSRSVWRYRSDVPRYGDGAHVRLVFEGIDTIATIRVDGSDVWEPDDMFHRWVVDLGIDDQVGAWQIEVELRPAVPVAWAADAANPLPRSDSYELPYNQVRKMACSFGWDWGPTTVTAGLWRAVTVERWSTGRLDRVLLQPGWDGVARLRGTLTTVGDVAAVRVRVRAEHAASRTLAEHLLEASDDGVVRLDVTVPGAPPWNVAGRGQQHLHVVEIEAIDANGAALDTARRRVGFRDVALREQPDAHGTSFEIHVNGARVWARGFNWIPAHVLPEAVERDTVRSRVLDAAEAGATMLRVWGGGVVESDDFYDACDELGILVWQDFSFACAAYGEDASQVSSIRREVDDAVHRIGYRASLAIWCGNNENLWGHEDWGWKAALGDRPWGARLYYEVIPGLLGVLDPNRPYVPGTPFTRSRDLHPNDPGHGATHHWDTWNVADYAAFDDKRSRFAAELGWQGPATWPTLVDAIGGEPSGGADPRLARLQKATDGMAKLERGVEAHLPHAPRDGRGWYLATSLVQARAVRAAIGRFRSLHEACSGVLWWQLDDCWPALSWSVVDVAGRRKLAWWAAAEVMAARAVLPTAEGVLDGLTLVNDTLEEWHAVGRLRVLNATGTELSSRDLDVVVPADGFAVVQPAEPTVRGDVAVVDVGRRRAARWLRPDDGLDLPAARVTVTVERESATKVRVAVLAQDIVRDLVLLAETHPELRDARVDKQLALLLPGDRHVFTVRGANVSGVDDASWATLVACSGPLVIKEA